MARAPGSTVVADRRPTSSALPRPKEYITAFVWPAGGTSPKASLPNPGTGTGDPRLLAALLPHAAGDNSDLPAAVVAMPDTNRRSLFIGLRQMGTPVPGPPECEGWYSGLSTAVVSRFNVPGVQLAVTTLGAQDPRMPGAQSHRAQGAHYPAVFAEAIITGPPGILRSLAGPAPPAACRAVAGAGDDSGGIRPLAVPRVGLASWAYEVTGTGKFPIWQWVEVVRGPGFLLEVRIPNQAPAPKLSPVTLMPRFAAAAYRRALSRLT